MLNITLDKSSNTVEIKLLKTNLCLEFEGSESVQIISDPDPESLKSS
jgi:hypothetical protein